MLRKCNQGHCPIYLNGYTEVGQCLKVEILWGRLRAFTGSSHRLWAASAGLRGLPRSPPHLALQATAQMRTTWFNPCRRWFQTYYKQKRIETWKFGWRPPLLDYIELNHR